jgi:hypothetical protein
MKKQNKEKYLVAAVVASENMPVSYFSDLGSFSPN